MKSFITRFLLPAMFLAVCISACKKDEKCTASTGGNVTIIAYLKHHTMPIISHASYPDTVMVKFNTQEFPGTNPASYDLVIDGEAGEDHVHIPGVTCGDYYLYAAGFDTTINERVSGGIPFTTSASSGEVTVTVPVTE
jgi:hypothetical protein